MNWKEYAGCVLAFIMITLAAVRPVSAGEKPKVVSVDVLPPKVCKPCEKLKGYLDRRGAVLVPRYADITDKMPLKGFPLVHYSAGKPDNGQKVYSGAADIPMRVTIIEWD
jgi:hypothetical protein